MELILLGTAVLAIIALLMDRWDDRRKLREMDNVLLLRDGYIGELKGYLTDAGEKLDDAHAELIKRMPRRGANGQFARKA